MKRSSQITLRLMLGGAVMATLAACDDADVDGKVYGSLEACLDDGLFSDDICAAIVDEAQADHLISAPRYAEKDLCEDEFGLGLCTQEEVGRSSFWVPLIAGYFIAEVVDEIGDLVEKKAKGKTLYRTTKGNIVTASGTSLQRSGRSYSLNRNTMFAQAKPTKVMTRTSVRNTGGFGSRSKSSSFGRSRGG